MRLSRASALAVYAVTYVAQRESQDPVQGREVARALGVSPDSFMKLLQRLVRARVLRSARGRSGGYRLGAPPTQITLLHIVEAIEGPLSGPLPVSPQGSLRRVEQGVEESLGAATQSLRKYLNQTRIQDLLTE